MSNFDAIIVGGGLIGMLSARALKLRGLNVLLVERGVLGGESSWAGGGILSPLHPWRYNEAVNNLAKYSQGVYAQLAEALEAEGGIDPEFERSGMLVVSQAEKEEASVWAKHYEMDMRGIDSREELLAIEPTLGDEFTEGLWLPDIAQLRNPRLVKSLAASISALGVVVKDHAEVEEVLFSDGCVQGVRIADERFFAETVVVAGGSWSKKLFAPTQDEVDILPVKGQMLSIRTPPNTLKRMILTPNRYLIPRRDGLVLIGSTLEFSGYDKALTQSAYDDLYTAGIAICPELEKYPVERQWSGLRPGSPSGVPYIDEHPEYKGLYINAGHYRNGVILGAASVDLMVGMIMNDNSTSFNTSDYALKAERLAEYG